MAHDFWRLISVVASLGWASHSHAKGVGDLGVFSYADVKIVEASCCTGIYVQGKLLAAEYFSNLEKRDARNKELEKNLELAKRSGQPLQVAQRAWALFLSPSSSPLSKPETVRKLPTVLRYEYAIDHADLYMSELRAKAVLDKASDLYDKTVEMKANAEKLYTNISNFHAQATATVDKVQASYKTLTDGYNSVTSGFQSLGSALSYFTGGNKTIETVPDRTATAQETLHSHGPGAAPREGGGID